MKRSRSGLVAGAGSDARETPSLARLRSVLTRIGPARLARARWRRPEEALEPRVRRLISDQLGVDPGELEPGVSFTDDLAVDSLDLLELAISLEEAFGITVPEVDLDTSRTYGELVALLETRIAARRAEEARAESEKAPPLIWARVLPSRARSSRVIEESGWLTPYTAEAIVDRALRAGPGARLEMGVPPNLGDPDLARLEAEFAWLGRRDISVDIRRDPHLPPIGLAA
jgi:acyl carrier protein